MRLSRARFMLHCGDSLMISKTPLRIGLTVAEVDAILGPNGDEEPHDEAGELRIYEFLVADEMNPGLSRLACAEARFVDGKLVDWGNEVDLIAETWRKIKAGDVETRRAA